MKHEKFHAAIIALLLSVAVAAAGIGCVSTGFAIRIRDFSRILGILFLCVSTYVLLAQVRGGGLIFAALGALLLSHLLRRTGLLTSLEALLYRISMAYHSGYGWGYIRWSEINLQFASMDGALTLCGCLVALAVCHCMLRRTWLGFGLISGLLPLIACCVVTDSVPDAMWLWLLLSWLLLLTLTHLVRRRNLADGNRMTALLLVPVMLFSAVLFRNVREEDYPVQAQKAQEALQVLTDKLTELFSFQGEGPGGSVGLTDIPTHVDLSQVGPTSFPEEPVMWIETARTGSFYLRGRAYDAYTGTGWDAVTDTAGEGGWPVSGMTEAGAVTVKTHFSAGLRYFPYYVRNEGWTQELREGGLDNPGQATEYTFDLMVYEPPDVFSSYIPWVTFTPLSSAEKELYCALPEDTYLAAQPILQEIFSFISTVNPPDSLAAAMIAEYVRSSATYDLNCEKMPEDETDFAIWFLQKGESGYCVHFATAATVLLRAAGIPARYVNGYRADLTGDDHAVTADQAHAWVEYLHPQNGWTVLDPTPGIGSTPELPTTEPPTTEPPVTEPPTEETTLPPTETTQPTETTLPPTETTQPTETTLSPTASSQPTETTLPPTASSQTENSGVGVGPGPGGQGTQWNLEWIRVILWILAVWALIAGQDRLRKWLRRKKMTTGEPNRQAMARWKYAVRLSRLSGHSAAELLPLAEKAVFSQHVLTEEELAQFDLWFDEAKKKLKEKGWLLSHLIRLAFAIE